MAKEFCNVCRFSYEGGCPRHKPKEEKKPSLLDRIKRIFKK